MAREILAYSDFRAGKIPQALAQYKRLSTEKNLPDSLHQRAAAMTTYLSAGGGQNYGSVPVPPAPKTPAPAATPSTAPTPQGPQKK
ncbi:MAG TPA: hypothetical protein VLT91_10570, partial [Rhizomicrobium sp.]|nr:hypothetical protein [Rhizomicrobium sp.]